MVAHIDLDSFFIAVERRRRPELVGRPVVLGGRPGGRGMVAAASREARRAGVRVGMPLSRASIQCPEAVFVDGGLDAYFGASMAIDELIRRESPDIEWHSIDEAYVALGDHAGPRASLEALERIHDAVRGLGFDVACGLARSKVVARVASQIARPRGVVHVLDGYEARFLSPLKIELLPGLEPKLARRLRGAGIRRLGQMARLSEAELAVLGGHSGLTLGRQAAGIDPSQVRRTALPPARIDVPDLAAPTGDLGALSAALRIQVERVGRDLRSRGVLREPHPPHPVSDGRIDSRTATLPQPSALDRGARGLAANAGACAAPPLVRGSAVVRGLARRRRGGPVPCRPCHNGKPNP